MFPKSRIIITLILGIVLVSGVVLAQEPAETSSDVQGITLLQELMFGGWVMIPLGILSILALMLILWYLVILQPNRVAPISLSMKVMEYLGRGELSAAKGLCIERADFLSNVLVAGLNKAGKEQGAIMSAMQSVGIRESQALRQRIRYLNDIAVLSPLVGLFGTVLGMIKTFNLFAFDVQVVKPIMLAEGVSQALVTTVVGLGIAIPSMAFYFYFRGRAQKLISRVEVIATEVTEVLTDKRTEMNREV